MKLNALFVILGLSVVTVGQAKTTVEIISSQMRKNDPTVMDVEYIIHSAHNTVNVRALAFQDGERSFWKVVRATEFVNDPDGNPTAQNIGDNIEPNVERKLAWKVSKDWKTDLAKVKFEVLCSDQAQLPLKLQTIPATAKNPAITIGYGTQTDADIFNALLWYYADGDEHFSNVDGYVDVNMTGMGLMCNQARWINRTEIVGERMDIEKWLYAKMGYEPLVGGNLMSYVRKATRKELWWNTGTRNCVVQSNTKPTQLYIGEKAYCVIDVSAGPEAETYPVTYLDTEPVNGWGEEYKTTKILLRRCEAGRYMMQNRKQVTLTKPFYMGVYMVTQLQYMQVMGTNPTPIDRQSDLCPVEISWNSIRGDSSVYDWPRVVAVDPNSFIGKLHTKTGIKFDLPTVAQWEYACRAGTTSAYGNGGRNGEDLWLMCNPYWSLGGVNAAYWIQRYSRDFSSASGSRASNFWGLYDMHSYVGHWCLDHKGDINNDPAVDFIIAGAGTIERLIRGGNGYNGSTTSESGWIGAPSENRCDCSSNGNMALGFRLSRTIAE